MRLLPLLLLLIPFSGCVMPLSDIGKVYEINDNYFIGFIDDNTNLHLGASEPNATAYGILIEAYVKEVGHNDDYIIVKQWVSSGFPDFKVDSTQERYWLIDIRKGFPHEVIQGWYSKEGFDKLLAELNAPDLKFTASF